MKIEKDKIIFGPDDFLSGLYTQYTTGITDGPAPIVPNLSYADAFNPFRYLGYASPGFDAADVTNVSVVTSGLRNIAFGVESSVDYGYLISSGNRLQRLQLTGVGGKTLSNAGVWPHSITGGVVGNAEGNDVCAYTFNNGGTTAADKDRGIFYSWNDSTASNEWNIGVFNTQDSAFGTSGFDDDFMTTAPASPLVPIANGNNKPHRMVVGVDDVLYIADGNRLHAYDGNVGNNGTFSDSVFVIPNGFIIQDIIPYSYQTTNFLVLLAYFSPKGDTINPDTAAPNQYARAYFWDYLNQDPAMVIDLDDSTVTAGTIYNGTLAVFTNGVDPVNGDDDFNSKLKMWTGDRFETVVNFIGNAPMPGGVEVVGNSIQWNTGGNIHSFGSPFAGMESGHNVLVNGAGTSEGVLRTVPGISGYQMICSGTTTSGGLETLTVGTYESSASFTTGGAFPVFPEGMTGRIVSVKVEFAQNASGGRDMNLYLIKEGETAIQILANVATVDSTNIVKEYYYKSNGQLLSDQFRELRLACLWNAGTLSTSAPIVKQVTVTFDTINIEST